MSYHDPHHAGKIVATTRTNSGRVAQLLSRYPGVTQNEAREIATFLRTDRQLLASDARSGSKGTVGERFDAQARWARTG